MNGRAIDAQSAEVTKAITLHLQRHSVAIFDLTQEDEPSIGSGTFIKIGEHYFIATAAHVIKDVPSHKMMFVHSYQNASTSQPHQFTIVARGQNDAEEIDVAWLEVDMADVDNMGDAFIPASRLGINEVLNHPACLAVFGAPAAKVNAALLAKKQLRTQPVCYLTDSRADGEAGTRVLLEYPRGGNVLATGETLEKMIHPGGLSGGGIWLVQLPEKRVWTADTVPIVGIDRAWQEHDYLIGTHISEWVTLLLQDRPSLKNHLSG